MAKKVLCIQLTISYLENFPDLFNKHGLIFNHAKYSELTIENDKIFFHGKLIEDFDFILFGFTEKNREYYLLIKEYLKDFNTPYIVLGNKNGEFSKTFENLKLSRSNIPVIPTLVSRNTNDIMSFVDKYSFPIISKPVNGRKGRGVLKHDKIDSLLQTVEVSEIELMIQPMIPNDGDYRVLILRNKVLGVMKRQPANENEFRSNISLGGTGISAELPKFVLDLCIKTQKVMGHDFVGVDVIQDLNSEKYYIMEVNNGPQIKGIMATTGVNVFEEITKCAVDILASNEKSE